MSKILKMKLFVLTSFISLIFLNVYDCYSTTILLNAGATEANIYINWVMSYLGVIPSLILTKIFFFFILFYVVCKVCVDNITLREIYFTIFVFILLNSFYAYFMYTINFQYMLLMENLMN